MVILISILSHRGGFVKKPLSPYLFLICVESLLVLLTKAKDKGEIHGVRICRGAFLASHLFFADGSVLFARVFSTKCSHIKQILHHHEFTYRTKN